MLRIFSLVFFATFAAQVFAQPPLTAPEPPLVAAPATSPAVTEQPANPATTAENSPPVEVWKTIELEWEEVANAAGYEVRLTPALGGKSHTFPTVANRLTQDVPVGNYKLQIRARAKETDDMSPWSAPSDLEVAVKEIIPLHPTDKAQIDAVGSAKQAVEFKWSPVDKVRIYTLKVWSEEKKETPWVFTGRATSRRLEVPPGRVYFWQVSFESANEVLYHQEPKIFSFTLQGTQLLMPEIAPYKTGKDISWKGSEDTKSYKAKLYFRALDETAWKLVKEDSVPGTSWPQPKLKTGTYKIEVVANAPRRLSSAPAIAEFAVKPTFQQVTQEYKVKLTEMPPPPPPSPVKGANPVSKSAARFVPRIEHVATAKMLDR